MGDSALVPFRGHVAVVLHPVDAHVRLFPPAKHKVDTFRGLSDHAVAGVAVPLYRNELDFRHDLPTAGAGQRVLPDCVNGEQVGNFEVTNSAPILRDAVGLALVAPAHGLRSQTRKKPRVEIVGGSCDGGEGPAERGLNRSISTLEGIGSEEVIQNVGEEGCKVAASVFGPTSRPFTSNTSDQTVDETFDAFILAGRAILDGAINIRNRHAVEGRVHHRSRVQVLISDHGGRGEGAPQAEPHHGNFVDHTQSFGLGSHRTVDRVDPGKVPVSVRRQASDVVLVHTVRFIGTVIVFNAVANSTDV
mmetsp:Transcript_24130/g.50140  ORF Transcript_24130/g.50140 Transcript_24130/m.50140 type:complete len:304 (-) Transcript_24130:314-1225(-)